MPLLPRTSPFPLEHFYPKLTDRNETFGTDPNAVDLNRMPSIRQLAAEDAMNGGYGYNPMQQAAWNNQANQVIQQQNAQEQEEHVLSQLPKIDTASEGGKQALGMLLKFNPDAAQSPRLRSYLATQEALTAPKKGEVPASVAETMKRYRSLDVNAPDAYDKMLRLNTEVSAADASNPEVAKLQSGLLTLINRNMEKTREQHAKEQALKDKLEAGGRVPMEVIEKLTELEQSLNIPPTDEEAAIAGGYDANKWFAGKPTPEQIAAGRAKIQQERQTEYGNTVKSFGRFFPSLLKGQGGQPQSSTNAIPPANGAIEAPTEVGTPEPVAPPVSIKSTVPPIQTPPSPADLKSNENYNAPAIGFQGLQERQAKEARQQAEIKELAIQQEAMEKEKVQKEAIPMWESAKQELLKNFQPDYANWGVKDAPMLTTALGKKPNEVAFTTGGKPVTWGEVTDALMNDPRMEQLRQGASQPLFPTIKKGDFTVTRIK